MGAPMGNRNAAGTRGSATNKMRAALARGKKRLGQTKRPKKGIGSKGASASRTKFLKEQAKQRKKNIAAFLKVHPKR
jgi:hypothetical protein